ncbi:MAG: hypothetical protein H0W21_09520 [Actinobacteria bacterium]|nr:hypothetical protein [Actinomycetota bacterium]
MGIVGEDDEVWVAAGSGVAQIDPSTNGLGQEVATGSSRNYDIKFLDGVMWVSATYLSEVQKVDISSFEEALNQ